MTIKRIDHIAIVVENLDKALEVYRDAVGMTVTAIKEMPEQDVKMAFLPTGDSEIEILEPIHPDSGIAKYLAKRGEGMHHVCLEVDDIEATLAELKAKGAQLIDETPAVARTARSRSSIPKGANGVLIELVERDQKRLNVERASTFESEAGLTLNLETVEGFDLQPFTLNLQLDTRRSLLLLCALRQRPIPILDRPRTSSARGSASARAGRCGVIHLHRDAQLVVAVALEHAARRRHVGIVAPDRHADVALAAMELFVGSKPTQPRPGRYASHQACIAPSAARS